MKKTIICTDKEEGKVYENNTEDDTTTTIMKAILHQCGLHTTRYTLYTVIITVCEDL